jgi:hypothetical protein
MNNPSTKKPKHRRNRESIIEKDKLNGKSPLRQMITSHSAALLPVTGSDISSEGDRK